MPRKAIDYSKTVIYKIQHIEKEEILYVGSTTDFITRKSQHKSDCNNIKCKAFKCKVYKMMRENGGWEEFKMIEIEKFPCNDKREAEKRENEMMKELKSNMNTRRSFATEEEMKERHKKYRENNKDKISEYSENNKEKRKERDKEYRENNKDKRKEYRREYFEKNKR